MSLPAETIHKLKREDRTRPSAFTSDDGMGCPSGKRMYRSRNQVKRALKHAQRAGRSERSFYECQRCGAWHLTKRAATKAAA